MKKLILSLAGLSVLFWATSFSQETAFKANTISRKANSNFFATVTGPTYIHLTCTYPYYIQYGTYYKNNCPCSGTWNTDFPPGVTCVLGGGSASSMTLQFTNAGQNTSFGVEYGDCGCDLTVNLESDYCN